MAWVLLSHRQQEQSREGQKQAVNGLALLSPAIGARQASNQWCSFGLLRFDLGPV